MSQRIPDPEALRREIKIRIEEVRAKKRLLQLAEAAKAARDAENARRNIGLSLNDGGKHQ
jgi:hypothetical protein